MGLNFKILKRGKKGLSPVVATVLLISIVIAIAVIVFLWFRSFIDDGGTKFDGENVELVCQNKVDFRAQYSSGRLSLSNTGNTPIIDFKMRISDSGGYKEKELREISEKWPDVGIGQGEAFQSEDISGTVGTSTDSITLIPVLVANFDDGRRRYTCEEGVADEEITDL